MKSMQINVFIAFVVICLSAVCAWGNITYTLTQGSGLDEWIYTYEVTNTYNESISMVCIYFDADGDFSVLDYLPTNLAPAVPSALPDSWEEIPIPVDWEDGLLPAAYLAYIKDEDGIPVEGSLGFSVSFTLTGTIPASQYYVLYAYSETLGNFDYENPITTGFTVLIPAPSALALAVTGLVSLRLKRRRQ